MKRARKKLTPMQKFAQGKDCALRVPGVCKAAPENENVCLCHAPYPNRGGMRKDDQWGAPGCDCCHALVDGRRSPAEYNRIVIDQYGSIEAIWMPAIKEWQDQLIKKGLIKV